jgi:Xaa-Pro aminopeptidase
VPEPLDGPPPTSEQTDRLFPADRIERAQLVAAAAGLDALLIGPGPDLRYLTGYDALPLERLTCLVVPSRGPSALVVPALEKPRADASPAAELGIDVVGWQETEDPYALAAGLVRDALAEKAPAAVAVSDRMWAVQALRLAEALPGTLQSPAGRVLRSLRIRKTPAEVAALRRAGAAIDRVHEGIRHLRFTERTERELGRDIAQMVLDEGHAAVNFVIVASGPNGASPHHDTGERTMQPGDAVVVDIGGTTADGYCSDATRNYVLGEPPAGFAAAYAALEEAQEAACAVVRPGLPASQVDAAARDLLTAAGYGELFVHRTGHGIGLEEHEEPWIVAGNDEPLEVGMAFSVEPGFYLAGRFGARIEDIVVVTEDGGERLNLVDRSLHPVA